MKRFATDAIDLEMQKPKELDLLNLAVNYLILFFIFKPKKPNWDLKRELEKKMEGLNAKTNTAIADIVRKV